MNQSTRKIITMHKTLHPSDDVEKLYVSRSEGGSGIASIVDSVEALIQGIEIYIGRRRGRLIITTRNITNDTRISKMTITRIQKCEEKQLYGRFKQQASNIWREITWTWRRKVNLKRETESHLIVAQNNAIRTNHIKARTDKMLQYSSRRYVVIKAKQSITLISEWSKLA